MQEYQLPISCCNIIESLCYQKDAHRLSLKYTLTRDAMRLAAFTYTTTS
jgi:hypothetical protein